ncbi:phage holin family protein [Erythrobacter sp. HKB08]|uniref:phage holin family protein n=1 Tax=Erythrobacter sp. HKB08 TaxID=2502843 RepID=UPI001008E0CF|nr:phage holin family protein [Erythrobacter sp. HKB08]
MLDGESTGPETPYTTPDEGVEDQPIRSLAEDVEALYEDGKTYVEAELAYQKTRARFVSTHAKAGAAFGIGAVFLFHMALIGLTVGAILSLSPIIGPLLATLAVVGVLLLIVGLLGYLAKKRFGRIPEAFDEKSS